MRSGWQTSLRRVRSTVASRPNSKSGQRPSFHREVMKRWRYRSLLKSMRGTVAITSARPEDPTSSSVVWRRASAPLALLTSTLLAFTVVLPLAAKEDPVQWNLAPATGTARVTPGAKAWLELKATVAAGWHLYSPPTPAGGPIITKITQIGRA